MIFYPFAFFCNDSSPIKVPLNETTTLGNSNNGCNKLTLDGWTTFDLYSLANTKEDYWNLVEDDLKERLQRKMVIFTSLLPSPDHDDFDETDDYIRIRHAPTALQLLRDFGPYLRRLTIEHVPQNSDFQTSKAVFELIQEQCTDTLEQLHLKRLGHYFFLNTTTPFKNVVNVSLTAEVSAIGNQQFDLSQLFPNLRHLYLSYVNTWNLNRLIVNYPNLVNLYVDVYQFDIPEFVSEREAIEIVKKNPQIRSLTLRRVQPNLLKAVAENAKNLEQFELYEYDEKANETNHFHFDSVKRFKLSENVVRSMPENITFSSLDEIQVQAYPRDSWYIRFAETHRNLKKFEIIGPFTLRNDEIVRLAAAKLNLTEISIYTDKDVKAESIVELIQSGNQLNRVQLKMDAPDSTVLTTIWALRNHFECEWQIIVRRNVVYLQKKQSN